MAASTLCAAASCIPGMAVAKPVEGDTKPSVGDDPKPGVGDDPNPGFRLAFPEEDQRDMDQSLERSAALIEKAVVAQHFAVIAMEDDERVVQLSARAASHSSASRPLISRSMSKSASMRRTATKAEGKMAAWRGRAPALVRFSRSPGS